MKSNDIATKIVKKEVRTPKWVKELKKKALKEKVRIEVNPEEQLAKLISEKYTQTFVSDKVLPRKCGTCGRYQNAKKGETWGKCTYLKVGSKPSFWCYPTNWVPKKKKVSQKEKMSKKKKEKKALPVKPKPVPKQEKKVTTKKTSARKPTPKTEKKKKKLPVKPVPKKKKKGDKH